MNNSYQTFLWTFLFFLSASFTSQAQDNDIVSEDYFSATVADCNQSASVCLDISLAEFSDYTFYQNGEVYSQNVLVCDFDTLIHYNYQDLYGQGNQGPYMLNNWMVNGEVLSGEFANIAALVSMMNDFDPSGEWIQDVASSKITGGLPTNTYSNMSMTVVANQTPFIMGYNYDIMANGVQMPFSVGTHNMTVTHNTTNATDNFIVNVMCHLNAETFNLQLLQGETDSLCLDFSELYEGNMNGVAISCQSGEDNTANFDLYNSGACVAIEALNPGSESVCFIAVDALGNTDTTYVNVTVQGMNAQYYTDTIPANQEVYQICLDTMELPGNVQSITNICPEESGTYVSFSLVEDSYCVKYSGLECLGTETACIVICDDMSMCDTTYLTISVDNTVCQPQPETISNTIYQGQSLLYCLDTDELPSTPFSITNACEGTGNVDFTLNADNYCVEYEGVTVGQDNACIVVMDDLGNTDTVYFNINVITPAADTVFATLIEGESQQFCPGTEELPGNQHTIFNICEESSGESVNFSIDDVSLCINTTALSIGIDTACIAICDENLICDTTYYFITVEEDNSSVSNLPPVAVDDALFTLENSPVVINVLENDVVPTGSQVVVYVLPETGGGVGPQFGTTSANEDGTIDYKPDDGFCGEDMFNYVLCNQFGCDTALVNIKVECVNVTNSDIVVHNGFSPNQDGVNDYFHVSNIENYTDNELIIVNRWGSEVYRTKSYRNAWDGTVNGMNVPDGTYYYMLEVDKVGSYHGYVQIKR